MPSPKASWGVRLLVGLALVAAGYGIGSSVERACWAAERAGIVSDVCLLKDYIKQLRQRQPAPAPTTPGR